MSRWAKRVFYWAIFILFLQWPKVSYFRQPFLWPECHPIRGRLAVTSALWPLCACLATVFSIYLFRCLLYCLTVTRSDNTTDKETDSADRRAGYDIARPRENIDQHVHSLNIGFKTDVRRARFVFKELQGALSSHPIAEDPMQRS